MQDVVKLLNSAGAAVKSLTSAEDRSDDNLETIESSQSAGDREGAFRSATSQYFKLLSSIDVRLRRQIYALEDSKIIPAESKSKEILDSQNVPVVRTPIGTLGPPSKHSQAKKGTITGGGLGSLDIGWLNCRNDSVGKEKEAELWQEAQAYVEGLCKQ